MSEEPKVYGEGEIKKICPFMSGIIVTQQKVRIDGPPMNIPTVSYAECTKEKCALWDVDADEGECCTFKVKLP